MLSQAALLGIAGSGALVLRAGGVELIADGGHEAATGMIVPLPELDIIVVTSEDLFERLLFNHLVARLLLYIQSGTPFS